MKPQLQSHPELIQRVEGPCILVVDDEDLIRDLCARVLEGYTVLQACNGEEALAILGQQPVDVVLSDVMMPDMDGLTLLGKVKELDPTQVVIMMTGFSDKEIVLRALRENADDFLTKPLNLLQLKTTLSKALEKKKLKEELVYLRRMDRLKSDFLGLVSHKLKTPVTAISLFLQNLAGDVDSERDPDFERHLGMALDESRYLQGLINDLLLHSEAMLTPASEQPEKVAPSRLLQALMQKFSDRAAGLNISLTSDFSSSLPELYVEPNGLQFAISALLDNALKFSPAGSRIELAAGVVANRLVISVRDQGSGIDPNEIPKIFEKFYQIDPDGTGQVRGFGLGLYFARHFAQHHHGSLTLENVSDGGVVARLSLPL